MCLSNKSNEKRSQEPLNKDMELIKEMVVCIQRKRGKEVFYRSKKKLLSYLD